MYRLMFLSIRDLCAELGFDLQITSINLDFEKACHAAVKTVWPFVSIRGCHFHLSQAWYRKITSLGLSGEYKTADSDMGKWLKRFFGLSFLPPTDVEDSLAFDIMDDSPDNPMCVNFCDYIVSTYASNEASFPPSMWADSEINTVRTTNACESFHKHFAAQFYHAHPSIFDFMLKLKDVQAESYVKIHSLETGEGLPSFRPIRRQKLLEMNRIKDQFSRGHISRKHFLKAMAWKNLPAMM